MSFTQMCNHTDYISESRAFEAQQFQVQLASCAATSSSSSSPPSPPTATPTPTAFASTSAAASDFQVVWLHWYIYVNYLWLHIRIFSSGASDIAGESGILLPPPAPPGGNDTMGQHSRHPSGSSRGMGATLSDTGSISSSGSFQSAASQHSGHSRQSDQSMQSLHSQQSHHSMQSIHSQPSSQHSQSMRPNSSSTNINAFMLRKKFLANCWILSSYRPQLQQQWYTTAPGQTAADDLVTSTGATGALHVIQQ